MDDATIVNLNNLAQNPPPGAEQVFNGRTAHSRIIELHKQAVAGVRARQIKGYNTVRERAAALINDDTEAVPEVRKGVRELERDLKRGLVSPDEVMQKVAQSIKGTEELVEHVRQVERDEEAATAMVDASPEDFEQSLLERFPSLRVPQVTNEYLRGEADSPFLNEDGA